MASHSALSENLIIFENIVTAISAKFISLDSHEIDAGINQALQTLGEYAGVDRSYLFLYSGDRRTLDNTHEWCTAGIPPANVYMRNVPVEALAWSNRILMRGETLHFARLEDLPPEAAAEKAEFERQGIQSMIAVPMMYRGVVTGFIGFDAVTSPKIWSEESIRLLKITGEIFVNALEHKRSQAIQSGQQRFLELLALGGSFSDTLHALVRIIEEQWPGMLALILLLDPDGKHLHHGASLSLPKDYVDSIEGLEIGPQVGSCGTASYRGTRVIVEDIATDPRWDNLRELALKHGLRACWSEPVRGASGQVLGTFAMYYRHPRSPSEAELRTIQTAAHLVGIAIQHQQAQNELQSAYQVMEQRVAERTHELTTLLAVSQNLATTLELGPLLESILDQLKGVVDFHGASILQLDGGILKLVAYRGPIPQEKAMRIQFPLAQARANQMVIEQRAPVIIPDVRGDSPLAQAFRATAGKELDTTFAYVRSWMGVPMIVKDRAIGMMSLDHPEPHYYQETPHSKLAMAFANQVAVAIENARLYLAERERRQEAERRRLVAEGLREILTVLNSNRPLNEVLDYIVAQACQLLAASSTMIRRGDTEQDIVTTEAAYNLPPEFDVVRVTRLYRGESDQRLMRRQPVALPDLPAVIAPLLNEPGALDQIQRAGMTAMLKYYRSSLAVPVFIKNELYGSLTFYYAQPRDFSDEDIRLATTLGDHAALAIENARLRSQVEQSAVAAERSRLARDLHDAVTQTLFSASLIAEVLPRLWDRNQNEGRRRLEELRQLTRGALAEMRTLLLELRPAALVEADISELFRHLVEAFSGRARVPVELNVQDEYCLPPDVKIAFYRITQEALNNIAKHAGASQVAIDLSCQPDRVELSVRDDGCGFDPATVLPDNLGLGIMKERAKNIGARLVITSEVGSGSQIAVTWSPEAGEELG